MLLKKQSTIGPKMTWVKEAELVVAEETVGSSAAVAAAVHSAAKCVLRCCPNQICCRGLHA